jgi:hypothetical protein
MTKIRHDSLQFTAIAGTVQTIAYPLGKTADDYLGGTDHFLVTNSTRTLRALANDFTVVFGLTNITLTSMLGLAAGQVCYLNLDRAGEDTDEDSASALRLAIQQVARITLGAVETAVAAGVCASQALLAINNGVLNGSLLAGGVISFATPRNVVAAWTGTAVLTVTGTDEYGNVMVESSASGTTFTGKKAFKRITRVRVSADVTGLTVGTGVVLGLPVYLADVADAIRESVDGVVPTAGTFVAADRTLPATALTGDIRGTWAPNAAPNAARVYEAALLVRSVNYKGAAQFAG